MATTPGNSINEATTGICGFTGTAFTGTAVTNHAIIVGGSTSSTLTNITATATTGQILQNNASADPSYSTATFPSTATTTGTILRADGTNWVKSTATFADTYTASNILYSNGTNTVTGLATANGGVLTTSSSGVPSIDTTNFSVLSTGVQMKGNNTNTAPPAGYLGQRIESTIAGASAVTLSTGTGTNFTSISLTPGIWDVSLLTMWNGTVTGTLFQSGITVNSNATGLVLGDNSTEATTPPTAASDRGDVVPSYRISLSTTTVYYANVVAIFTVGTLKTYGRISATRVG